MHRIPVGLAVGKLVQKRREAKVAGLEVAEQHLVVEFAVARRLGERDPVGRVGRHAETVVEGLDAVVAFAGARVLGEHEGQEPAGLVTRADIRVDVLDEVVLVALGVVLAGLVVAALRAVERLAVEAVRFAAYGVAHARRGHQVADIGSVDEDLRGEDLAGEGTEGNDPVALLGHAARTTVQLFVHPDFQSAFLHQAVDRGLGDVRFEVIHIGLPVVSADAAVDLAGHAADRFPVEDVTGGESAAGHAPQELGRIDQHHARALALGLEGRRDRGRRIPVDDDVVGLGDGGVGRATGEE